jgi:anti-anti-sigma factor
MQLNIEQRDGLNLVVVTGDLDTFGAERFRESLSVLRTAERYVVSLTEVSFVDSAGLHALFSVARTAKDVGARIAFVVPSDSPSRRIVELVQLGDVCPVCDTPEEAESRLGLANPEGDGLAGSTSG